MHEELLIDYASGAASPALGLLAATHLALKPQARGRARTLDALGGGLLERAPGDARVALEPVLSRLDRFGPEDAPAPRSPLDAVVAGPMETASWKLVMPGMRERRLDAYCAAGVEAKLVRFRAGRRIPRHGHTGSEITLVLRGAYEDALGRYEVGDVEHADAGLEHQPCVDPEQDCICLVVMQGGITVARPLREFIRYVLS